MRAGRILSVFGILLLCALFLSLSNVVTAERGEISVDVSDPFSVSCTRLGEYTQVTIKAYDMIGNLEIVGFPSPVDTLRAGWSITFSREGMIDRVVVRATWRGQIVERATNCK